MVKLSSGKKVAFLVLALVPLHPSAFAQDPCREPAGRFASIEGQVQIRGDEQQGWRGAKPVDRLCKGDTIRVGERSRAAVVLVNEAVIRLDQNTTMRLVDISGKNEDRSWIEVAKGAIKSFIRKPRLLSVNTPYLNGSIEGTEFQVSVADNAASILVLEGRILASNDQGKVSINPGEIAEAQAGAAPTSRLLVRPRDAVQWSLYYPPILANSGGPVDSATSFEALDKVPESDRDAAWHLQRASLLLSVGRQDAARAEIDTALQRDPNSGLAHALLAIIHVVHNEREQALVEGNKAVELSDTAATRIALSYAQQADFRVEAARDTLLIAVKNQPEDALAWARLSELWLMLGDKPQSRAAAAKATALAPDLERTQMVLGFAALAEFRNAEARSSFERAIELGSSDPMAHLGLGLARISAGQLEAGRAELEVAVALDANQALLRTYLGKAYFAEKRTPLDSQQYSIAKQLDPHDPTAYLYDGILKQTLNRPVEALADLEQSMALNDERAVYRSRLLLDKDRAARGTSQARVYNDLGFVELGVTEATNSLTVDPANASAHRFLSDSYQGVRRREIARVSELLQAQMMQDININPIQLSKSEANLNIVTAGGPASAGFNEFTPLFERNQMQFDVDALAGNNSTWGAEAALTGLYNNISFGLSALTYNTDGWRPNNGLEQDIYDVFVQAALTDQVNVQAEYRHRKSTEGDLAFNFDPEDFLADKTTQRELNTTRLGLRYTLNPQAQILLSYVHGDRDENLNEVRTLAPGLTFTDRSGASEQTDQLEAQFLGRSGIMRTVFGVAYTTTDRRDNGDVALEDLNDPSNSFTSQSVTDNTNQQPRAYGYFILDPAAPVVWTLGASYDSYEDGTLTVNSFNPKLGMQWDVRPDLLLRAAAFQVVKPALVNNATLEPTQVAGFNQLFDDINGTKSQLYGVALDWRANQNVKGGVEFTYRTLDEPIFDFFAGDWITEERKEQWGHLYVDWTPSNRVAVHSELVYDQYSSQSGIATEFDNLPEEVVTWSLPVKVNYFDPSGFFAGLGATYVDQSARRSVNASQASGDDNFFLMDASIGYRFPKRLGILSLAVMNLFDTDFKYQDDSYREFRDEPSTGPYFPERTVMGRLTLSF